MTEDSNLLRLTNRPLPHNGSDVDDTGRADDAGGNRDYSASAFSISTARLIVAAARRRSRYPQSATHYSARIGTAEINAADQE